MAISIELPPNVEAQLRSQLANVDEVARLGLAIEAFRAAKLSLGQFAELLGVSQYAAEGLLKERGISLDFTETELAAERDALRRLSGV